MRLTREDLAMMLDAMNNYGADYISIDARVCDEDFDYIDFDIYHGAEFVKTVLTLEP